MPNPPTGHRPAGECGTPLVRQEVPYRGWTINLIAVRCSPSMVMSMNAGTQIRSTPLGATKPRAMATALTAWLTAPAPMACISALPRSRNTAARAPATAFGLLLDETFRTSMVARLLGANRRLCQSISTVSGACPAVRRDRWGNRNGEGTGGDRPRRSLWGQCISRARPRGRTARCRERVHRQPVAARPRPRRPDRWPGQTVPAIGW